MADLFDALERRDRESRARDLYGRLPEQIARAMSAPGWAGQLEGVEPKSVTSREALAKLPLLRKSSTAAAARRTIRRSAAST